MIRHTLKTAAAGLTALFLMHAGATAAEFETAAREVIIIDYATGAELFAKNADQIMEPASMTKLMTIYLLFEHLKNGSLKLDDTFLVSENAWRKQGSKMFVPVGQRVKVEDLIQGIIVQSGNDASIVVAEGLAGSEEAFAQQMTDKAHELGMSNTVFRNASGWPDPQHHTTARDLATLAAATIRHFPDYYKYYSEMEFTYNKIKQGNRNPLLYHNSGADGLKTGHTESAGYGLTASAVRGNERLIMVAHGMSSMRERASESARLLDWAFREFASYPLFKGGEKVADANVWLGDHETVPLMIQDNLTAVMKRGSRKELKVAVQLEEPVAAPIAKGTKVGKLVVTAPDMKTIERPLLAAADVGPLGMVGRVKAAVSYLIWGGGQ
jgi:serine-type D-Ala-D-Ala carboxypeptidase (penicillin-binding protein 5/6)